VSTIYLDILYLNENKYNEPVFMLLLLIISSSQQIARQKFINDSEKI